LSRIDDFNLTELSGIKELYHKTYYSVAIQLKDKGMAESDIKAKYRKAVMFLCQQTQLHQFDQNLDIVLYLLTLCLLE